MSDNTAVTSQGLPDVTEHKPITDMDMQPTIEQETNGDQEEDGDKVQ
jgi:hypothetical protein